MFSAIYLLSLWPLEEIRDSKLEVFNEVTGLALLYHLICFSDMVPDPHNRYNIGYSFIAVGFLNIAVHLIFIVSSSVGVLKQKCRHRYSKKNAKKQPLEPVQGIKNGDKYVELKAYNDFFSQVPLDQSKNPKKYEPFFAIQ